MLGHGYRRVGPGDGIAELGNADFSYSAWIKTDQAGGNIISKQNDNRRAGLEREVPETDSVELGNRMRVSGHQSSSNSSFQESSLIHSGCCFLSRTKFSSTR